MRKVSKMKAEEDIANALQRVREIALENKANIVQSGQLARKDRELLIRTKWLSEVIKGWYMLVAPHVGDGESSAWYANFWDFMRLYLNDRFGSQYCLSAEHSLDLHSKNTIVPKQVIVICEKGSSISELPFDTSIFTYVDRELPKERVEVNGIQCMSLPLSLCKISTSYFESKPNNAKIALNLIGSSAQLTQILMTYNYKLAAERLLGAYEAMGQKQMVKSILRDFKVFGWQVISKNPFARKQPHDVPKTKSPSAGRIFTLWSVLREHVIKVFPEEKGPLKGQTLKKIDELYKEDAYNSLSIEGYQVNEELIAKVRNNEWNPDGDGHDAAERNALAARGYFEAFTEVKKSISRIRKTRHPGKVFEGDLDIWFQSLFGPTATANIIKKSDLIGYRHHQVYIRNSRHVPLAPEELVDSMEALFECLKKEPHAAVRAILGHYIFVFIHPYMDGNGRIGRFLMNTMFVTGGYPWTIIHVSKRERYLKTLEHAGIEQDLCPFARFVRDEQKSMYS